MVAVNDFKAFATAVDANVMTQADYLAALFLSEGFQSGIAQSQQLNKVWRQGAFMAAVLAQYIANTTGDDVLDDGDEAGKVTLLTAAIQISAGIRPAVLEPLSAPRAVLLTEYAVGFNRLAAPAATAVTLPGGAAPGQEFVIDDVSANSFAFPITVSPPGGHTISGAANFTLNVNGQSQAFRFYGGTVWSLST